MKSYFVVGTDGGQYGPASLEELKTWVIEDRVGRDTILVDTETGVRKAAGDFPEIFPTVPASSTTSTPPPPQSGATITLSGQEWWFKIFSTRSFLRKLESGDLMGFIYSLFLRVSAVIAAIAAAAMMIGIMKTLFDLKTDFGVVLAIGAVFLLLGFGFFHAVSILWIRAGNIREQAGSSFPTLAMLSYAIRAQGESAAVVMATVFITMGLVTILASSAIGPQMSPYGGPFGLNDFRQPNPMDIMNPMGMMGGGFMGGVVIIIYGVSLAVSVLFLSYALAEGIKLAIRTSDDVQLLRQKQAN